MNKVNIVIADDHPIVLHGLKNVIEENSNYSVIGEAFDGEKALNIINKFNPDIAVLDLDMPKLNGLEILKNLSKKKNNTKVIIITAHKDESLLNKAIEFDAKGYLLKETALVEINLCIEKVISGKKYISSDLSEKMMENKNSNLNATTKIKGLSELTLTEKKILKLVSANKTTKEIADELFVSYRTVENHRNNICKKLNITGGNALLRFALENKNNI